MVIFAFFRRRREAREHKILALLRTHGELSGVEIYRLSGLSAGSMYATLYRMEEAGRLTSRWGEAVEGWPRPRRLYRSAEDPDPPSLNSVLQNWRRS